MSYTPPMVQKETDEGRNVATLKTLENELEQELQRFENSAKSSAINQGEILNRIKESGAFEEAGHRHFQPYYRERWQERIGKAWSTAEHYMNAARYVEEMTGLHHDEDLPPLKAPITDYLAAQKLRAIEDPADRVKVWNEYVESGESHGRNRENLDRRIREFKGEPPRPEGPRVRDALSEDELRGLPSGDLTPSERLAYKIHSVEQAFKGVDAAEAVEEMRKNPDTFRGKVDALRRINDVVSELLREAEVSDRRPLRAVVGDRDG